MACIFHVSPRGSDAAEGSLELPLQTVSEAARRAQPGDTVLIHAGMYRERVDPPRGGTAEDCRITYAAAGDGPTEIRGSEIVTGWESVRPELWSVWLPDNLFGEFNPYAHPLRGHWFVDRGRKHHAGAVFAGEHWLVEASCLKELETPGSMGPRWFSQLENGGVRFWAEFPGMDPNQGQVEVTVRQTVFYPSRAGCDFITVCGLILSRAATPWAPPTTEQIGLLGTNWARGWIIENNTIRHSCCTGVTLGKYHDPEDFPERDVVEGTQGEDTYHGTIRRALAHGWTIDRVGNHVVRGNHISHCEMAGICGSFGAARSRIEGNVIHDIHVRRLFGGCEQAGIKFHGAIDTLIAGNRVFRCIRGIWLDWMSQGTRVTRNLCYANGPQPDLFMEVNHGPFVIDNNFFLSPFSLLSCSEGGAYIRNFFLGTIKAESELKRVTPYHAPHQTAVAGWRNVPLGDDQWHGNIIASPRGLSDYDQSAEVPVISGNLYLGTAQSSRHDHETLFDPGYPVESVQIVEEDSVVWLHADRSWTLSTVSPATGESLRPPRLVGAPFSNQDGTPVDLTVSYAGLRSSASASGPFAELPQFPCLLWPPSVP